MIVATIRLFEFVKISGDRNLMTDVESHQQQVITTRWLGKAQVSVEVGEI